MNGAFYRAILRCNFKEWGVRGLSHGCSIRNTASCVAGDKDLAYIDGQRNYPGLLLNVNACNNLLGPYLDWKKNSDNQYAMRTVLPCTNVCLIPV